MASQGPLWGDDCRFFGETGWPTGTLSANSPGVKRSSSVSSGIKDHCFWAHGPENSILLKVARSKAGRASPVPVTQLRSAIRSAADGRVGDIRILARRPRAKIFSLMIRYMLALLFNEVHKRFFYHIGQRSIFLLG